METDTIVELVLQMKVPFEYKMNESEALKWKLEQAVRLTRLEMITQLRKILI